jgi:hypothetical protein
VADLYRKRPVTVEVEWWDGTVSEGERIIAWMGGYAVGDPCFGAPRPYINIKTLEGWLGAYAGDFIIKGVKGEFCPCKPDIFAQTYELVEAPRG